MSSKEWVAGQRKKLNELTVLFPRAVASVHAASMERIYEQGFLGHLGAEQFQYNSTKPIYVDPDTAPRSFKPQGKPGGRQPFYYDPKRKVKKRGSFKGFLNKNDPDAPIRPRTTKYFESYKAFRGAMGRETAFVNLDLNGLQRRDNSNSLTKLSAIRWAVGFKNAANSKKFNGQIERYGDYNKLTEREHQLLRDLIASQRRTLGV